MPTVKRKPTGDAGLNEYAMNSNRETEYLVELQGREGSKKYRMMSKSDPQIGMLLRAHKNPIRSCQWGIPIPDDATETEKKAIGLIKCWFFKDYVLTFDTLLGQILSCLEYGFSSFERVYQTYRYEGTLYLVPRIEQRMQTSIEEILPDDGIVKQLTIGTGLAEIPLEDMVFFTLNQQGEDLRGESLLRNAYKPWKRKQVYEELMGIGIQRFAMGVPSMMVPKSTKVDSKDYIAVEQLLQNIVVHENAYMIYQEGYEFDIKKTDFNADQVQKAIDSCDTKMALSVLAQFVLLGQQGNTGAYALSRDQSDFFLDGLQHIVDLIESIIHRQIITPMIKLNFGETIDPDRIRLSGDNLNKKIGKELSEILASITPQGFVSPTVDDEIKIRKSLDLPELSEEEIETRREKQRLKDINAATGRTSMPPDSNPDSGLEDDDEDEDGSVDPQNKLKIARALKFAEARIKNRRSYLDKNITEMQDFMRANLLLIKDKLIADIEMVLKRGQVSIQGLKAIEVSSSRYQEGLERKLGGIAQEGWDDAKANAKSAAIKFADELNPRKLPSKILSQFILNQAQSITDEQVARLKNKAILAASNGPIRGYSINQTISNVEKVVKQYIESPSISVAGSLVVVEGVNFGANQFNKEIEDKLWGYVFVAIDDDRTTEICSFYDGKTYSVDSAELTIVTPPLHPNCRSYMEPIYKTDEQPEKIDNVIAPPSIQVQKTNY